jgi:DNA-binding PadR family transcriptional regulator
MAFPWAGGGRPRSRRGDVRSAVLRLLAEQPMHGYQIITELAERSGGAWRPSPGSVYPTLQQLEDEGLVTAAEQDGRRTYSLTDAGRVEVEAMADRRAPWDELADEDGHTARSLRTAAGQLMGAVVQVASAGSERQLADAERLLAETRKSLYRLLAQDDGEAGSEDDGA